MRGEVGKYHSVYAIMQGLLGMVQAQLLQDGMTELAAMQRVLESRTQ
jgi:hypothetical protein